MSDKKEIVFVDDEDSIIAIYEEVFEFENAKPVFFTDPKEALSYILKNGENVSVLVTDLKMPEMSGLELIKELKNELPHIINFVVTAFWKDAPSNLVEYNISEVIKKPTDLMLLRTRLEELVK